MSNWVIERLRQISPRQLLVWAVRTLFFCVVAWPVSSLTVARDEPQVVTALSWIAIILSCVLVILTTDLKDEMS